MELAMLTNPAAIAYAARTATIQTKAPSPSLHSLVGTLEMMGTMMSFGRGEEIYGEGEHAEYLYKVVSGAVRMYKVLDDGRRQVGAFYLPGDIFGFEFGDDHAASAEAIGNAKVLVFKRSSVLTLSARDNDVARQLWNMTARELQRTQGHMLLLIQSASERVTSFLLEMAERTSGHNEVELPMSRQDIADYLGLTIETVSRTLTQLEHDGIIAVPTSRRIQFRKRVTMARSIA
jgi:CRP-like cAMP-binding protein